MVESSQLTEGKKEKDNAETARTQRFRREDGEAGQGGRPKFMVHGTAFLMTCQGISYIVLIRMARLERKLIRGMGMHGNLAHGNG